MARAPGFANKSFAAVKAGGVLGTKPVDHASLYGPGPSRAMAGGMKKRSLHEITTLTPGGGQESDAEFFTAFGEEPAK